MSTTRVYLLKIEGLDGTPAISWLFHVERLYAEHLGREIAPSASCQYPEAAEIDVRAVKLAMNMPNCEGEHTLYLDAPGAHGKLYYNVHLSLREHEFLDANDWPAMLDWMLGDLFASPDSDLIVIWMRVADYERWFAEQNSTRAIGSAATTALVES